MSRIIPFLLIILSSCCPPPRPVPRAETAAERALRERDTFGGRPVPRPLMLAETQPTTRPSVPKFLIGVYSQPMESLPKWRARGANFLVASELRNGTVDQRAWRKAARDNGFVYVDTYLDDGDATDPNLLGWMIKDSDEWNRRYKREMDAGRQAAAQAIIDHVVSEANRLREINERLNAGKWVYATCDGMAATTAMFERPPYNGVRNHEKTVLVLLNARGFDWYPVANTASTKPSDVARRPMYLPAQTAWRLRTWSEQWQAPPAVYVGIIEAAKKWNAPLGVTGEQMRDQVAYLLGDKPFPVPDANGRPVNFQGQTVDALVWWTHNGRDGPAWSWDAMTDEQVAAMTEINANLHARFNPPPPPSEVETLRARVTELEQDVARREEQRRRAAEILGQP